MRNGRRAHPVPCGRARRTGAISTDEFEKALVSMNLNLAPHQLRDIFSVIDTNGDGQLSIQVRA